jgi:hypothetical protein
MPVPLQVIQGLVITSGRIHIFEQRFYGYHKPVNCKKASDQCIG